MKEILSKEQFVEYINNFRNECDVLTEIYQKFNIDLIGCDWWYSNNHFTDLLSLLMGDKSDKIYGTTIDWWCWETDFGRDDTMNSIYDSHTGELYRRLTTAEDLYDYLVEIVDG